jgi:Trk K+ transport system NAD-binding subunit
VRFLVAQLIVLLRQRPVQQNARVMGLFLFALAAMVSIFAVLFHVIMAMEGQDHTWFTGFYWALTVMSTLGFGDITFHTDLGRLFSMVVLISGTVFLLVLFPFIVIQFFWAPWMNAQAAARAPRALAEETADHVILTHYDEVSAALIERLEHRQIDYVLLVPNREEAGKLHDRGLRVAVGMLDDPESWERVRARQAGLVATTCNDFTNTNAAFTVRGVAPDVPVIATADDPASVDILELAGCTHVVQLAEEMGQALARRTIGADAMTHTIGEFGPLAIAEATAARTPLVGKTLAETRLRQISSSSTMFRRLRC